MSESAGGNVSARADRRRFVDGGDVEGVMVKEEGKMWWVYLGESEE